MDGVFLLLVCCSPLQEIDCAIICFFGIIRENDNKKIYFVEDDLKKQNHYMKRNTHGAAAPFSEMLSRHLN